MKTAFAAAILAMTLMAVSSMPTKTEAGPSQCIANCKWKAKTFNWSEYQLRLCKRWCYHR